MATKIKTLCACNSLPDCGERAAVAGQIAAQSEKRNGSGRCCKGGWSGQVLVPGLVLLPGLVMAVVS